jgi:predicted DNA-binding transcriptional regulator
MLSLSLPGLIGAAMGLLLGLLNYGVVVAFVEKRLRALDRSVSPAEKADFERRIVLMRRIILVAEVAAFGLVGYLFGRTLGG